MSASPLPEGWSCEWAKESGARPVEPGCISLRREDLATDGSVSALVLDQGLGLWGERLEPTLAIRVRLSTFPSLDESLALYFVVRLAAGEHKKPHWAELARYALEARQGYWPDKVPVEQAVQAVYTVLVQDTLELGKQPAYLERVFALFALLDEKLGAGGKLLEAEMFDALGPFGREVSLLAADRALYEGDVRAGRRFLADLPEEAAASGASRVEPVLVLFRPSSRCFKFFARADERAPGGRGYALLVVEFAGGDYVITADPRRRIKLGWLAKRLTEREGRGKEWYDGQRHEGTLVASPDGMSGLDRESLLTALRGLLSLKELRDGAARQGRLVAVVATLAIATAAAGAVLWRSVGQPNSPSPKPDVTVDQSAAATSSPPPTASHVPSADVSTSPRGSKGDVLPERDLAHLVDKERKGGRKRFAVLAGVCDYPAPRQLHSPCKDARAMRDLLVESYGYEPMNVVLLENPTATVLKKTFEDWKLTHGEDADSTFLFYYSGHGGYVESTKLDWAALAPKGYYTNDALPRTERGWDMTVMPREIDRAVASPHIMIIIDACYSGWTGAKGGDELDGRVRAFWKKKAHVVLTAGDKGQRAWEDDVDSPVWGGHSAFTYQLLQALSVVDGVARADANKDRIVTDEELASFVQEWTPPAVAHEKQAKQDPRFFRLDDYEAEVGQFLFVPTPVATTANRGGEK